MLTYHQEFEKQPPHIGYWSIHRTMNSPHCPTRAIRLIRPAVTLSNKNLSFGS